MTVQVFSLIKPAFFFDIDQSDPRRYHTGTMDATKPENTEKKEPPVRRWMVALLAVLLLAQMRNDNPWFNRDEPVGLNGEMRLIAKVYSDILRLHPHPPSPEELREAAIGGMLQKLGDRYTRYLPSRQFAGEQHEIEGLPAGGLGILIERQEPAGLLVRKVIPGLPADKAGLSDGDIITAIDGQELAGLDLWQMRERLLGETGTKILLEIQSGARKWRAEIERAPLPGYANVHGFMLDEKSGVGYVRFFIFSGTLPEQLREKIDSLQRQNLRALIIDLRLNGGGDAQICREVADYFLPAGKLVATLLTLGEEGKPEQRELLSQTEQRYRFPLALLIERETASAAELFSAALRQHRQATLIGAKSFGKAKVQKIIPYSSEEGGLVITNGYYLTAAGENIDGKGLQPDIAVPLTEAEWHGMAELSLNGVADADWLLRDDPQLRKAAEMLRGEK
jgi:carboxyl-terminal processing protease